MRLVYKNPKELASKIMDLVDTYQDDLITYEKLETTIIGLINANENAIYKNGFMPVKLASTIGEERKAIIDEIAKNMK